MLDNPNVDLTNGVPFGRKKNAPLYLCFHLDYSNGSLMPDALPLKNDVSAEPVPCHAGCHSTPGNSQIATRSELLQKPKMLSSNNNKTTDIYSCSRVHIISRLTADHSHGKCYQINCNASLHVANSLVTRPLPPLPP